MCKVVVSVGHVDESLDEVGALNEAEEHLQKTQEKSDRDGDSSSILLIFIDSHVQKQ